MPKNKEDLSIDGALKQLTNFFFDVADEVTKVTEPEDDRSDRREPVGEPETPVKPNKRIASPFVAKEKGAPNESGKSSKTKPPKSRDDDVEGTGGEGDDE